VKVKHYYIGIEERGMIQELTAGPYVDEEYAAIQLRIWKKESLYPGRKWCMVATMIELDSMRIVS